MKRDKENVFPKEISSADDFGYKAEVRLDEERERKFRVKEGVKEREKLSYSI